MKPSKPVVLLLTHSGDYFTVDKVEEALLKQGVTPFRLDTDQFPQTIQLTAYVNRQGLKHYIIDGDRCINIEQIQAVWLRKIWTPQLNSELEPPFREGCIRESQAALLGFLDALSEVRWIDSPEDINFAENKLRQLRIAREVGLSIPRTLVTNNPQEVRAFFEQLEGNMIAKMLTPLSYSMEGSSFFVYTTPVKAEDLVDAESLCYSPMVFQETIPKQQELRIIYIAGKCFAGALNATLYSQATMDWRKAPLATDSWEPAQLPLEITNRLNLLMEKFKLLFGAIDMIKTPTGNYVFLEVNPTGEWGMLERDLNYPIAEAIAHALVNS